MYAEWSRFARHNVRWLLVAAGLIAVPVAVEAVLLDDYALGLAQGLTVAVVGTSLWTIVLLATGTTSWLSGAWGEDNTNDVLRRARRRGVILGWISNLEVQGGDIDHVVITSQGVLVIDSKWHSRGLGPEIRDRDARAASASARRAALVLHSIGYRMRALPIVVVWGGSASNVPAGGSDWESVVFLRGHDLGTWLRRHGPDGSSIDHALAQELMKELARFKARVRPPDPVAD